MEKLLADINEILSGKANSPDDNLSLIVILVFAFLALIAFALTIITYARMRPPRTKPPVKQKPKEQPKQPDIEEPLPGPSQPNINVGEFGKIVSKTTVSIKGVELNYFIIKKSKYDKDTLPIGSIVVVIKRSAKEAYVKLADDDDKKRMKGGGH